MVGGGGGSWSEQVWKGFQLWSPDVTSGFVPGPLSGGETVEGRGPLAPCLEGVRAESGRVSHAYDHMGIPYPSLPMNRQADITFRKYFGRW